MAFWRRGQSAQSGTSTQSTQEQHGGLARQSRPGGRRAGGAGRGKPALPLFEILQQMAVPLFVLNREGKVVLWNTACAALTGLPAGEVLGTQEHWRGFYKTQRPCLADLVLAGKTGQAGALYAAAAAAGQDGSATAQNWCDLPNGQRRYLRIDAAPLRALAEVFIVETLQDMTALKEAQDAIAAERATAAREQAAVAGALGQGLAALASGDLHCALTQPFVAQYEKLRLDFNAAVAKLGETMRAVTRNAGSVRASAGSMLRASRALTQAAARGAQTLDETSGAVTRVTGTVRETAAAAAEAQQLANGAQQEAARSGAVVAEAVQAMGGIEESSRRIGNILGVIDEIAFQTNLLALNAGVEAARAGEAGRGFAVVATEVRALAQRSADAAREIKALMSASGTQVQNGVHLVGEAGGALTRIAGQVEQLNSLVTRIAESARAQNTGLAEVGTAMERLIGLRREDRALLGAADEAGQALTADAGTLEALMAQFITSARPPAESRRAAASYAPAP